MFDALLRNFRWHRTADRWGPRRLLVVDLADEGAAAVVMGRSGQAVQCVRSEKMPGLRLPALLAGDEAVAQLRRFAEEAQYISVLMGGEESYVRLLNFPGRPGRDDAVAQQVRQTLGVDEQFDVCYAVMKTQEAENAAQFTVLAAAFRRDQVDHLATALTAAGFTPVSLMHRGVVAANLAETLTPGEGHAQTSGFLHMGPSSCMLLLYAEGNLALARQFRMGSDLVVQSLMDSLKLDRDTAAKVLASGSFDVTANISPAVKSWMHQIAISLDFIERRYGKRIETLQLLSSGTGARVLREILVASIGRTVECPDLNERLGVAAAAADGAEPDDALWLALCEGRRVMQRSAPHAA